MPTWRTHRAIGYRLTLTTAATICALAITGAAAQQNAAPVSLPQAAVAALNRTAQGPHPGFRANHAKGVLLTGHFNASKQAATLSKAAHLRSSAPVPVLVRFSDATGIPDLPDADPNASPHGMAIRFTLPDKSRTDIVAISATYFPVARPEEFVALLNAIADSGPGTPAPTPVETFLKAHPTANSWAHTPRPPPQSFATLAFYGINAFKFTNDAGNEHFGRYQILPAAGQHALSAEEVKAASGNYLMDEIQQRIAREPVKFRLLVQLAEAGDPTDDGSKPWPDTRKKVELGTITLDGVVQDQVGEQKRLMFNPLSLPSGIEPSSDPVLLVRPAAYAVSFQQRAN